MRYKASLTSCVILLLVMQLVLRSGTPILAVRSVPAATAPPAIELSDLAFTTRAAQVSSASDGSGIHHYFVPFDDRDLWNLFEGKASCHFADAVDVVHACLPLLSNIFVTAGADGTRLYYDHWEDGYDDWQDWDNGSPVVSGTTITDTLDAGATRMFRQRILVTEIGQGPPYYYDGRDRITILGEDANVVRLANVGGIYRDGRDPSCRPQGGGGAPNSDSWLAAAWEVLEVADWGTAYNAIVGEDLDYSGGVPDDHDYAGLSIMAAQDGTEVYYRGVWATDLDAGGTHFVPGANDGPGGGGVDSTHDITATAPIQVQIVTGACSTREGEWVSGHGYTLIPEESWDRAYWAPVPGFDESCNPAGQDVDTDIYLHNPAHHPISVTATSGILVTDFTIPPFSTVSVLRESGWADLSTVAQGTHISSTASFWGVVAIDSATRGATSADDWDWGHSLVPKSKLSSQVVVGYAPGHPEDTGGINGNVVFVVATADDSRIYVDLDQDGGSDAFDMDGDGELTTPDELGSGQGIVVQAGQVLRVGDAGDEDLTGARIFTRDLEKHIAAVWGQDPCRATRYRYQDLGYTVLPLQVPRLLKTDGLAVDADGSGEVSPGDIITYTIVMRNNGMGTMNNVVLTDSLPYTYTDFVVGSLQVTTPPPADTVEYYDGGRWGTTPISDAQEVRITWPYLGPTQTVTITFRAVLSATMPPTVTEVCNQGVASSDNTDPVTATVCAPLQQVTDLEIIKDDDPDPLVSGGVLTYTLLYANHSGVDAQEVTITDTLPSEVTYGGVVEPAPGWSDPPTHTLGPPANLTWSTPTLAAGASGRFVYTVTLSADFMGTITNSVSISTTTSEARYDNNDDLETTLVGCDVGITKVDDTDPVAPGARLVYSLAYTHEGTMSAENVVVTDTLPPEVAFVEATPAQTSGPNPLLWNLGPLAAGEGGTIVVTVTVGSWVTQTLTNTVSIATDTAEIDYSNNDDDEPTDVWLADVTIQKSDAPDPVGPRSPDRQLLYTLVYTNTGPAPAENVVLTDTLPPEVTFSQAHPAQTSGPNPLLWDLGTLAAGASGTVAVTVTVEPWASTTLTNTVHIATDSPESRYDNNSAQEPTVVATDLAIAKFDDPDPAVPGEPLTYTLVYTNNGPFVAREVLIIDTLPDEIVYDRVVGQPEGWSTPPTYTLGPPATLTWYTPTLTPGATGMITYVVTAAPDVPERIENLACISWRTSELSRTQRCDLEPTPVRLLYFRATPLPGAVLLEWETAWEVDTYGFSLLRGSSGRIKDAQEIAFVPAAGHGSSGGAIYSYRDRHLESGRVYTYWLAEVDTSGRRTFHQTVAAARFPGVLHRVYLPLIWRQ